MTTEPPTNALEGLRCPECSQTDVFKIVITAVAIVFDSGVDSIADAEWDDSSPITCADAECDRHGFVGEFILAQDTADINAAVDELEELVNIAEASNIEVSTDTAALLVEHFRAVLTNDAAPASPQYVVYDMFGNTTKVEAAQYVAGMNIERAQFMGVHISYSRWGDNPSLLTHKGALLAKPGQWVVLFPDDHTETLDQEPARLSSACCARRVSQ